MKKLLLCATLGLAGCGVNPGKNADPVLITGRVLLNGKPVSDVVLNFQATGDGCQAMIPVRNGVFQGSVVPGRYTYYITEGAKPAAFKVIPQKYYQGSLERQLDIGSGSEALNLSLD